MRKNAPALPTTKYVSSLSKGHGYKITSTEMQFGIDILSEPA